MNKGLMDILYKSKRTAVLLLFYATIANACKKFVDIAPPSNEIISEQVFKDDKTATSAAIGLYAKMMNTNLLLMNGGVTVYTGLSSDEIYNTSANTLLDEFQSNSLSVTNRFVQNSLWRFGYDYIYHVNLCIEGIESSKTLSQATKQQLLGEMKLVRGTLYFNLINLFGDVPLVITTNYQLNEKMPRTQNEQIWNQIILDFKDAQNLLSEDYPTNSTVRPTKHAATAMLARAYLYRKQYTEAIAEADKVINSGKYNLVSSMNAFLADNKECIWSLLPVSTAANTAEGATFIPISTTARPTYAITNTLLNAFEAGDLRKTNWLKQNTFNSITYYYPFKYKVRSGATKIEYNILIRLAELYLIRAEARAHLNNINGNNSAASDLNMIRSRAGLASTNATTQSEMLLAIERERQVELFAEWGHRWFDLKRTGRINTVLSTNKANWSATAALYPIPFQEIQRNPSLIQNTGY